MALLKTGLESTFHQGCDLSFDCRAYKLGKRRWSYNQFELALLQDGVDNGRARSLVVMEATYCKEGSADEKSSIGQVVLSSITIKQLQ